MTANATTMGDTQMNEEHDERGELVRIGSLWTHQSQGGQTFLSGHLDARILIFRNKFKKPGEKQPDYRIYVAPKAKPNQPDALADGDPDPLASADAVTGANEGTGESPF